jgi:hypothetical protein
MYMDKETEQMKKINEYARREMSPDEVYIFDVILCDNQTDRDGEKFSLNALSQMEKLFVGKTGIFDHNPKGENQTARIFETKLAKNPEKISDSNEEYTSLKASCYMVKTNSNQDLIKEIDAGIKKEVSVSCACQKKICSICGKNRNESRCNHIKGKVYKGKVCTDILDDVTDAYEWSFVAVPAQKNAGVTKYFSYVENGEEYVKNQNSAQKSISDDDFQMLKVSEENVKKDIIRLAYLSLDEVSGKALNFVVEQMNLKQLFELKEKLMKSYNKMGNSQFDKVEKNLNNAFKF